MPAGYGRIAPQYGHDPVPLSDKVNYFSSHVPSHVISWQSHGLWISSCSHGRLNPRASISSNSFSPALTPLKPMSIPQTWVGSSSSNCSARDGNSRAPTCRSSRTPQRSTGRSLPFRAESRIPRIPIRSRCPPLRHRHRHAEHPLHRRPHHFGVHAVLTQRHALALVLRAVLPRVAAL